MARSLISAERSVRWLSAKLAPQQRRLVYTSAKRTAMPASAAATNAGQPSDVLSRPAAESAEKDFSEVPGPKPLVFLGNYMHLRGRRQELHKVFSDLRDEYGDICKFQVPGRSPMVILSDVEAIEAMLRNEGRNPTRMGANAYVWYFDHTKLPQGFLFTKGEQWRQLRYAVNKQLVPRSVMNLTDTLRSVSDDLVTAVKKSRGPAMELNSLYDYLTLWAFEGVAAILINEKQGMLTENPSDFGKQFLEAGRNFTRTLIQFMYALPVYKLIPTKPYKEFDVAVRRLLSLAGEIMEKKMAELTKAVEEGHELQGIGFLDQWLLEGKLSNDQILPIFGDLLAAGIDTTTNASAFLLHEVAKSPTIQNRLHTELVSVLGDSHRQVTAEDITKLSFAKNCIREILRLYPATHLLRGLQEDMVLLGYRIPKGTTIVVPFYAMGRDTRYFRNPQQFNPDRWDRDHKEHHPFASLPFGFGPRACYGRRLAELEMSLLLTQMVRNFNMSTDQTVLKECVYTTLQPAEPVIIRFEDRQ